MAAMSSENHPFPYLQHGSIFNPSEASGALLLIMLGKVSLNIFLLQVRRQKFRETFMGYFCISLALLDLVLLVTMSFLSHFQNLILLGVRFTKYHTCLLAQIAAFTYGILHYPVFVVAGLDYYFTITQSSKSPNVCRKSIYTAVVVFTWISAFLYVLSLPGNSIGLDHSNSAYQCPFYFSSQTYWLSLGMLLIICLVPVFCWSEVVAMVQSIKLTSFENETVLVFPYVPECSPRDCPKHLLTRLLICFIGTWAPFVFLQMLIVLLGAQIPAFIEMNVPWLYFVNSFLVAVAYWMRRRHIELTEVTWDADPFISWKFCFVPFNCEYADEAQKSSSEIANELL
ncbi:probable G-protein coupled receptor 160 [Hemicordylus capensis]|uniref:probable G-protein coupled receptor 160 n=1 Tax=Hemicordylus capensis TaxID=884348 RepID=UPI0023036E1B|nr:probable G-protein coupled receptor 160 [Hemicordylus capensis]XP_053168187.1 probable G-protein coupled receptor 160 [Hemicordylus capensis]XP_053168188.1 probable G-protein coupled receptor 160 [Hemicordylus capensis]XP_053168189.1 probable G-protein coupled receptor 160 [Hemicordylus capensis]XP_053168190.1 probable G-protein coupled receptor 160 [Hemicordylus capensis]XP_053168191.1 probable G-protein coupled receptor 160 [Hemicordylus capensis]XP_053168192.1 probable G-protein coupled